MSDTALEELFAKLEEAAPKDCAGCTFFERHPDPTGHQMVGQTWQPVTRVGRCLRYPPIPVYIGTGHISTGEVPWVTEDHRCGEWSPKEDS